jgi:glycosyltransferase involved in cell wall biosynthesis
MNFAPIVLFVCARLNHTRLTVDALLNNPGAELSDLIIFSDAAREEEKQANVDEVRAYLKTITGFRSVTIHHRTYNFGLAKSIIEGVSEALKEYDAVIVLEDDLVTSPYFLSYMNEALEKYAEDDRVVSIHGYIYPVNQSLPETFFLRGADCWGWATWRRGWANFNPDGQHLLDELKRRKLIGMFDFNGAYSYSKMLKAQIKGRNDSWAVRWHASAFLADKLTLYPGRSLVHNIGNDGSGTHCGDDISYDLLLSSSPIDFTNIEVQPSAQAQAAFEAFFRKVKGSFASKLLRRSKKMLAKLIA